MAGSGSSPRKTYYVRCPLCGGSFATSGSTASVTIGRDSDLCPRFPGRPVDGAQRLRDGVTMCPRCSFAVFSARGGEDFQGLSLSPAVRHDLEGRLEEDGLLRVFRASSPPWLPFHAAEVCGRVLGLTERELGDLCLRGSWVCRKEREQPFESAFQLRATRHFMRALEEDRMSERELPVTVYLVGELNRRLGHSREALNWYVNAGRVLEESKKENLAWLGRMIERQTRLAEETAA